MLVLLTTANFPDVMLPAYETNWFWSIFFIVFMLIGVFFLFNVLLASVYGKFKERLEADGIYYIAKQSKYFVEYVERCDPEQKGYLTEE